MEAAVAGDVAALESAFEDVLRCKVIPGGVGAAECGREADYLIMRTCCDANDTPACEACLHSVELFGAQCIKCDTFTPGHKILWREL